MIHLFFLLSPSSCSFIFRMCDETLPHKMESFSVGSSFPEYLPNLQEEVLPHTISGAVLGVVAIKTGRDLLVGSGSLDEASTSRSPRAWTHVER